MKRYAIIPIVICLLAFSQSSLKAQAVIENNPSSVAMPFSRVDRNPVSAAMGGTSMINDMALLPFRKSKIAADASFSDGVSARASASLGKCFGFRALFSSCKDQEYTITGDYGIPMGQFVPSHMQFGGELWVRFADNFGVVANARYLMSTLSEDDAYSAISADVIAVARFGGFRASAGVRSLGTNVGEYSLPSSASAGVAYDLDFGKNRVGASAEFDYFLNGSVRAAVGLQYTYGGIASVRGGYNVGADSMFGDYATLGAGLNLGFIALNIAYLTGNIPTQSAMCIGVEIQF